MAYIKVPLDTIINVEKIVSAFDQSFPKHFHFKGEAHDFWELRYAVQGEAESLCGDERIKLSEGDISFHRPGEFHDLYCEEGARIIIVGFDCRSAAMEFFCGRHISLPSSLGRQLTEIIEEKESCFYSVDGRLRLRDDAPIGAAQLLRSQLETLLIRIMRHAEDAKKGGRIFFTSREEMVSRIAADVKAYLAENLHERVSLDGLAKHFHFSKSHLCHLFKENTGQGIKSYFLDEKLKEAERLLSQTELSVTEIAERMAFDSPQHFAKSFRQHTGLSPSAYRAGKRK